MGQKVSRRDKEFLERLREVIQSRQATLPRPTDVIGRTPDKMPLQDDLDAVLVRWDVDGSLLRGRVDTADRTIYVGSRRVFTAEDGVLVESQDYDGIRSLWHDATPESPGEVLLKRLLRVEGWTIVGSETVINRRRPEHLRPKPEEVARLRPKVAAARHQQMEVAADLGTVLEQVRAGRHADAVTEAVRDWNGALKRLAAAAGLAPDADLDEVEAAVDAAEDVVRARQREQLVAALIEVDALMARFPEAARLLAAAREELAEAVAD